MEDQVPKRREVSKEVKLGAATVRLVRPFNELLGGWQATSVKLLTLAQRGADETVKQEIEDLLEQVTREAARFEAAVAEQRTEITRHSRIEDTRRSFRMVLDRLLATKGLLLDR